MKVILLIFFLLFASINLFAQIEGPILGAYPGGGYGNLKFIKDDSTGWLFIPYDDTTKIIFIAKDYTTYRQFNQDYKLLVEGSFGGRRWTDFFLPSGKWTEFYLNGTIKSTGNYYPYSNYPIGGWKYYYPNGQLKKLYSIDMIEVDSIPTFCKAGLYEEYYENGQIKVRGWYQIELESTIIERQIYHTARYHKVKGLKPVSKHIGKWDYYKPNGEIEENEQVE